MADIKVQKVLGTFGVTYRVLVLQVIDRPWPKLRLIDQRLSPH